MTHMIVYSSVTGNTQVIAKAVKDALDENACIYYGKPDRALPQNASVIFVGFWVQGGTCSPEVKQYLKSLENKKIALFGTAGFGGTEDYFETILTEVKKQIPKSNEIVGSIMFQGKMPQNALKQYQKLLDANPNDGNVLNMIYNYNNALSHPDKQDIEATKRFARDIVSQIQK
ncbi:MAG: flavodoxin family protein [Tenuifilaceae bacterium]|nr:flavodoxin family protein [Tenuifilaceae bacterium]